MDMLIGGTVAGSRERPHRGSRPRRSTARSTGSVPVAGPDDVDAALTAPRSGAVTCGGARRPTSGCGSCCAAAELADERAEEIAQTISGEAGKAFDRGPRRGGRSGDLIRLAAFEGTQLYGEALPLDANRGTGFDKIGFTIRQPVGVVVAITPFNYPALLVLHKLAPALAAGNAVVLKPARTTPLTALALAELLRRRRPARRGALGAHRRRRRAWATLWSPTPGRQDLLHRIDRHRRPASPRLAGVKKLSLELGCLLPGRGAARRRHRRWPPRPSPPAGTSTPARSASPCSGSSPTRRSPGTSSTRWCPGWRRSAPATRGPPTPPWAR